MAEQTLPANFEPVMHVICRICGSMGNPNGTWPQDHNKLMHPEVRDRG